MLLVGGAMLRVLPRSVLYFVKGNIIEYLAQAPAVPTVGSAWTTVGPSGKQTSATTPPARSPVAPTPAASSSTATARVNGTAARPAPTPASKAPTNNAKVDEFPIAPSGDFLKWLAESLKGLNSSVNGEIYLFLCLLLQR